MSFGLNKLLKKILPRKLFYRALIIVAAPVIILQVTISIVFFDSIWIKANKGMTRSLVSEIKTLFDVYRSEDTRNIQFLTNSYKKNFDFVINIKDEDLPKTLAAELGLDINQLEEDMKDPTVDALIKAETAQLRALSNAYDTEKYAGVRLAVPKFFINGREPTGRSFEAFSAVIEEELKK